VGVWGWGRDGVGRQWETMTKTDPSPIQYKHTCHVHTVKDATPHQSFKDKVAHRVRILLHYGKQSIECVR